MWKWNKEKWLDDAMNMVINRRELELNIIPKNYFYTKDEKIIDNEYEKIIKKVCNIFYKDNIFFEKIKNNLTAKTLFYTQYIGGCKTKEFAEMLSLANLILFISASMTKEISSHKKGYSLMDRIIPFRYYIYNKKEYLGCIARLSLLSLYDHYNDKEYDLKNGFKDNNPFLTNEIDEKDFKDYEKGLLDIIQNNY